MADRGAKNIILASRSGKAQENTISLIEELSEKGVRVEVCQVDVASELDLSRMVSECAEIMPPVKGVIHAAWVNKVCGKITLEHRVDSADK
jgi:phthiocerol/phenolphthiocerol synthesis type-I polyketide synthase C